MKKTARQLLHDPTLNRLAHWNQHHKVWVRLGLGGEVGRNTVDHPGNRVKSGPEKEHV